jgi:predicted enzyme related to lactoylglutathione lyase
VQTGTRPATVPIRSVPGGHSDWPIALGCLLWALGCNSPQPRPADSTTTPATTTPDSHDSVRRVTGLGGVFFKSNDPVRVLAWYRTHLGITSGDWGGFAFQWREKDQPNETGYTVWSAFPDSTSYFSPSPQPFMLNFRVADLGRLIAALKEEGVEVVGEIEQHPNGKFAWILDPEGRKIELWEPVPSTEDPYLK